MCYAAIRTIKCLLSLSLLWFQFSAVTLLFTGKHSPQSWLTTSESILGSSALQSFLSFLVTKTSLFLPPSVSQDHCFNQPVRSPKIPAVHGWMWPVRGCTWEQGSTQGVQLCVCVWFVSVGFTEPFKTGSCCLLPCCDRLSYLCCAAYSKLAGLKTSRSFSFLSYMSVYCMGVIHM